MADSAKWQKLIDIMATLRSENGCPWDKEQTHESLKRYLLEEAYEVLDAIDSGDDAALCDELGDVLLQVVFHAQLATETGRFTIDDVVDAVSDKMIRRHPHVFSGETAADSDAVLKRWEEIKAQEKAGKEWMNAWLPAALEESKALIDKAKERKGFVCFSVYRCFVPLIINTNNYEKGP